MKKGWTTRRIGDVCELATGGTPSRSRTEYFGGEIPWLVSGDIHRGEIFDCDGRITDAGMKSCNAKFLPVPSVMIALNGQGRTRGTVALLRTQATCNQSMISVAPKPNSGLLPEFLFANLQGRYEELRRLTSDDDKDRRGLNMGLIRTIEIPIAPLPEQRRIVGLLDEAFAGIAIAKANAERNLQNARALFATHLQSVFAQRGKGWVTTTIGETCTLRSGTTVSPTLERPLGKIPYLKVADMTFAGNEDQITTSSRFLLEADRRECSLIPKGATIFPKRGGAILTNKKRITAVPICADLNIMAVIPSSRLDAEFLYFYFLNVDMRMLGTGSSIPQINNYDIDPLLIAFPETVGEQRKVVGALRDLRERTQYLARIYERKLVALDAVKKSLLHQAFAGELP